MESLQDQYCADMIVEATLAYCKKMLTLSADPYVKVSDSDFEERCRSYVRKVLEYDREKTIKEHIEELYALSPFPDDICGYLHEYNGVKIFQPKHLMCKVATFRVSDITFEFLVEYGILRPDVEIYYGIKAISDYTETRETFKETVEGLSREWFKHIENYKANKRGPYAGHYHRHKFTNNVHDGTFWISWVRMESEERMAIVIEDLKKKVYQVFKRFIESKRLVISPIDEEGDNKFDKIFDNLIKSAESPKGKIDDESWEKDAEKHKDLRLELDRICLEKNRNSTTNEPLIIRRYNDYYQFVCDKEIAWIFIQKLFCKKSFESAFKLAELFWEKLTQKERNEYGNSFRRFVDDETSSSVDNCLTRIAKSEIDRSWVMKHFRAKDGSEFKPSFFKQGRVQFDDKKTYDASKELLKSLSAL